MSGWPPCPSCSSWVSSLQGNLQRVLDILPSSDSGGHLSTCPEDTVAFCQVPSALTFWKVFKGSCSAAQSCLTLCNPMDCSTPGFLSFTISQSLLKLMSIKSVMPSNHLILCCPLLLLPSIFASIRVFYSKSALHIKWPKYRSFSFSIGPSNEYSGLISFRVDWLPSKGRHPVKGSPASVTTQVQALQPCLGARGTGRQRVSGGTTGVGVSSYCLGPRRLPVQ